jgi:succinoglycan biosynthesis transport protein ExoP
MELKAYLTILWRRKWIVITTVIMTVAIAVTGTFLMTPTYTASTTLRIEPIASVTSNQLGWDTIQYTDRLANTYLQMATSDSMQNALAQQLGLARAPKTDVKIPANTELMQITAEAQDPTLAARAADTLATMLIARVSEQHAADGQAAQAAMSQQLAQMEQELNDARAAVDRLSAQAPDAPERAAAQRLLDLKEATYTKLLDQYNQGRVSSALQPVIISIIDPAVVPQEPSKPQKPLNIGLGLLVGMLGGLGLAFLFENMDSTLRTTAQIEDTTKLAVLGTIPTARRLRRRAIFNDNSPQQEAFRHLRTSIFMRDLDTPVRKLLITSAEPGEGKSTVVANLAYALAKMDYKVVVVDCDLRMPTQHAIFNLPNEVGLSSVLLQHTASVDDAVQDSGVGPYVLTSGPLPLPCNPAELLVSPLMGGLIAQLTAQYDIVLMDTPSLLAVTDAAALMPIVDVDGVVLVVGRAHTRQEAVQAARKQLDTISARLIGVVVNRAESDKSYTYYARARSA